MFSMLDVDGKLRFLLLTGLASYYDGTGALSQTAYAHLVDFVGTCSPDQVAALFAVSAVVMANIIELNERAMTFED